MGGALFPGNPTPVPSPQRGGEKAMAALRLCALALILSASPVLAQQGEDAIPPGQEEILADMMGRGADLPAGCRWAGASIERTIVVSRYRCAGGEVIVELHHPERAPAAAVRGDRFALVARGGSAPPGLLDAIAARARARGDAFHWARVQPAPAPPEPAPRARPALRGAVAAVAGATLLASALGYVLWRRASFVERLLRSGGASRRARVLAIAAPFAIALGFCAAVHGLLRALGRAASATLLGGGAASLGAAAGAALGCTLAASIAGALLARLATRGRRAAILALVALAYVGAGYPRSLPPDDLHRFGSLSTAAPGSSFTDTFPARPRITYHVNAAGFREPAFAIERQPGVVRGVLVGDSYVFGVGVEPDGTLSSNLEAELRRRRPDRRFEVLNLGIPGDNLASHVSLYEEAAARLDPQIAVVCLTLPNDLSRWDDQVARDEARRAGAFSVARWLVGEAAVPLWDHLLLDRSITPAGLAHLDGELGRLARIHAAAPAAPALFLLTYGRVDPRLSERLARVEGAKLVDGDAAPGDFIPGDGHPTAAGNKRFAAWIAEAIERDAAAGRILSAGP